jgi:hypothetical protein
MNNTTVALNLKVKTIEVLMTLRDQKEPGEYN